MTKKVAQAKKNPNELRLQDIPAVQGLKGTPPEYQDAKMSINPAVNAATAIRFFEKKYGEVDLTHLVNALNEEVGKANSRDLTGAGAMLVAQATILDTIFNNLAIRSAANMGEGYMEATETYMKLALRAQSQCRSTWEALSAIKNPPVASYVKQANIAHGHQQVNNGPVDKAATSRTGEKENAQNKLLEAKDGKRLDTGTARTASGINQDMETVETIDRPKDK